MMHDRDEAYRRMFKNKDIVVYLIHKYGDKQKALAFIENDTLKIKIHPKTIGIEFSRKLLEQNNYINIMFEFPNNQIKIRETTHIIENSVLTTKEPQYYLLQTSKL